ncbi:aryl hydrocarbon receptor repressor-like [Scyliorhinus canicula]|uniref:aryl hydrocarbon receptor repressor-like n=1 Tax=Scyliorhinus canicula TaxID=7830 RepID=UPI0018F28506|nr:aryl hydrocarbon receptor repressor-like [Scyliorhinus canicula]XP_038652753.1 aryl hydrocarbon receptor repressor-like [Scyliorhinus canicula]
MIPLGECMYAGRKRRKPIPKHKSAPTSVKSNPSKRHRDRLNAELDHLASLLPFPPDIISKLDKLSVLRLSVSYLRVKNFFQAFQDTELRKEPQQFINHDMRDSQPTLLTGNWRSEGELLLDALDGFVLLVSADGKIFYVSPTIIDYLGFHQTDVMHQSVYDFIHVDDRQEFQRQLHWAMNPPQQAPGQEPPGQGASGDEYLGAFKAHDPKILPPEFSPFLNRCFISRLRCLLDSTSGFLTMQFQGRLKYLQGQRKKTGSGVNLPPQLGLFCIAVPLLFPPISELKLKGLLLKGKHRLDLSPTPLDAKGIPAAGWSDAELRAKSGCHYLHFTDMLYCAENQIRLMDNGEKGLTVFRVLTKDGQWVWLQTNGHLPYRNKSPECATMPKEELKDTERSKEERLRNQSNPDQSDSANRLVYSNCTESSQQLKHLYEQHLGKGGREDKYEPIKKDGDVNQNEPLNFCTSFPRAPKVTITDDLWGPEYSRRVLNSQPPRTVERISSVPGRVAKPFCGRSRLLSEPQLRGGTQAPSFQNIAQSFRGIGEEMHQSQSYGALHYTDLEDYPSEPCKSENVRSVSDFVAPRPKDHPVGYCNSTEMFLGLHIKSEYNPDPHSELDQPLGSPGHQWTDAGEMGKKMAVNFLPQVKCDPSPLEQLPPCEKLKTPLQPPFCRASVAKGGGLWMADHECSPNRLSKHGTDMAHFSPQRASHSHCTLRDQPADRFQPAPYLHHPIQDKGPSQETFKLSPQFKDHDLIHTVIKREPSPSAPWTCDNQHSMQATLQRNMPSCLINSLTHKNTQNSYL